MKRKTVIRRDRLWKHWKSWLSSPLFDINGNRLDAYDPEPWRAAFERFQSHGKSALTDAEYAGIWPLICAQKNKEITLTSLVDESMEWWANRWGWIYPFLSFLGESGVDRLTRLAVLRIMKGVAQDSLGFFLRHPGIPEDRKMKRIAMIAE